MKHFHKACSRVCQQIMPFQKEKIAIWHWICIHFEISKTGIGETDQCWRNASTYKKIGKEKRKRKKKKRKERRSK